MMINLKLLERNATHHPEEKFAYFPTYVYVSSGKYLYKKRWIWLMKYNKIKAYSNEYLYIIK